jgi:4-amino-4-deoxy-L-arabinose transferase-like glycosyltransferase
MAEKEITIQIRNLEIIALLAIILVAFALELKLTLSEPIVFGDEGHHARLSQWIAQQVEYPKYVPFTGSPLAMRGFSRPSLWNLLGASFLFIFGFHQEILKFLIPFTAVIVTGPAVYVLTKRLYNKEVAFIATVIALAIPSFVTYSVLYYTDILLTLYLSMSILTLILAIKSDSRKYWILSGLCCGLAFVTKSAGYAVFFIAGIFFLYQLYKQRDFFKLLKNYLIWFVFAILLIVPFFARNYLLFQNLCSDLPIPYQGPGQCSTSFVYTPQYNYTSTAAQVGTEVGILNFGIADYLNFAYGNIWFVVFAFFCGLVIALYRKSSIDVLILISLLPILVIYLRTPDTRVENMSRYFLGWAPIIGIIAGLYFEEVYSFVKKYQKYLALAIFMIVIFFSFQVMKEKLDTMYQVKGQWSQYFWDACTYIREKTPKDSRILTVWAAPTIFNCQRTVGGGGDDSPDITLSGNLTLAMTRLKLHQVNYIFVQKGSISTMSVAETYPWVFIQMMESNPQQFVKVFENGETNLQNCLYGGCDGDIVYQLNYTGF